MRSIKRGRTGVIAAAVTTGLVVSAAVAPAAVGQGGNPAPPPTANAATMKALTAPQAKFRSAAAATPGPGYATAQSAIVAISAATGSKAEKSGNALKLTLKTPRLSEITSAAGKTTAATPAQALAAFNALGTNRRGMVLATTANGTVRRIPAIFGVMSTTSGALVVTATPVGGTVAASVREEAGYQLNSVAKPASIAEAYKSVTVIATAAASKKWNFGVTGAAATTTAAGSTYTITIPAAASAAGGVQPNRQAASTPVNNIATSFTNGTMRKGAAARIVVSGVGADNVQRSAVLTPTKVTYSGGTFTVVGTLQSPTSDWGKSAIKSLKNPSVVFDVSNPGKTTSFVVVVGDSIASGEGGRFAGPVIADYAEQLGAAGADVAAPILQQVCGSVDLACVSANADADNKVKYEWDMSKVYEKGSYGRFENAKGQPVAPTAAGAKYASCHRSLSAPGTWLARYYKVVKKLDVESINIACSGAITDNLYKTSFKGEAPQSQQLKALSDWVPVPYVTMAIGANDIKFSTLATACYFTPIAQLADVDPTAPDAIAQVAAKLSGLLGDVTKVFDLVNKIFDAQVYDEVAAKYRTINPYFDDSKRCQNMKQKVGGKEYPLELIALKMILDLPTKVKAAVEALHAAAPTAKIIHHNYPNLIPGQFNSLWDREKGARNYWNEIQALTTNEQSVFNPGLDTWTPRSTTSGNNPDPDGDGNYGPCVDSEDPSKTVAADPKGPKYYAGATVNNVDVGGRYVWDVMPVAKTWVGKDPDPSTYWRMTSPPPTKSRPPTPAEFEAETAYGLTSDWANYSRPASDGGVGCTPTLEMRRSFFAPNVKGFGLTDGKTTGIDDQTVLDVDGKPAGIKDFRTIYGKPMSVMKAATPGNPEYEYMRRVAFANTDPVKWDFWGATAGQSYPFIDSIATALKQPVRIGDHSSLWTDLATNLALHLIDHIGAGQLMHFQDQNWAAQIAIPMLNKFTLEGSAKADPQGKYLIQVGMSQAFNGRELASRWGTSDPSYDKTAMWSVVARNTDKAGAAKIRTPFTVNVASGQSLPILCPKGDYLQMKKVDGTLLQAGQSQCIGSPQEALHPNWFGQAAEGQCIVSVVTRGAAAGLTDCVRSVGDNKALADPTRNSAIGVEKENIIPVTGKDMLCLTADANVPDIQARVYTSCNSATNPDPVWDTERFAALGKERTFKAGTADTRPYAYTQWDH